MKIASIGIVFFSVAVCVYVAIKSMSVLTGLVSMIAFNLLVDKIERYEKNE